MEQTKVRGDRLGRSGILRAPKNTLPEVLIRYETYAPPAPLPSRAPGALPPSRSRRGPGQGAGEAGHPRFRRRGCRADPPVDGRREAAEPGEARSGGDVRTAPVDDPVADPRLLVDLRDGFEPR